MADRKPTLLILQNANPRAYAELCEKASCYSAALAFYGDCKSSQDLLHAAHLAYHLGNNRDVRKYCELAREAASREISSSEREDSCPIVGMGSAMSHASAQNTKKKVDEETSKLLVILKDK